MAEPINDLLTEVTIYNYNEGRPRLVEIMIHDPSKGLTIKHNVESYVSTTYGGRASVEQYSSTT